MTSIYLRSQCGFTLIELLVATCLGCLLGLAFTQEAIMAHGARRSAAKWMHATQLATERLERLRAGDWEEEDNPHDGFAVSWQAEKISGYSDLVRVTVTVSWQDGHAESFRLEALLPEAR